ncbi:MAG TPA: OmpA family protein [Rhizomicrobium sp.]|jgi:outer membrane protein OmpA-like peptidoglycan-associated protein|nr:OmpA family protein [Rhizomicrobium sp.]
MTRIASRLLLVAAAGASLMACQTMNTTNQASTMAPLPDAKARYVVFFTPWSARLEAGGHAVVGYAAHKIVRDGHVRVTVIGYTDPNGSDADNKKLSAARANTVADALVSNGVDRSLIDVKSVGSIGYVSDSVEGRRAVIAVDIR